MNAISLDADYGNPYNDIGVYLMQLGRPDEAVGHQWLDRAICAQAVDQVRLDHSRLSVADEIRELGEEWKRS